MNYKERVLKVREILLLSQKELSVATGISFATINRLEKGHTNPSLKTRVRFERFCESKGIKF